MEYDDLKQILKVMDQKRKSESDGSEMDEGGWAYLPETLLVSVLKYLPARDIVTVSEVCKRWNVGSYDSLLWKYRFLRDFKVETSIPRKPGEDSKISNYIICLNM